MSYVKSVLRLPRGSRVFGQTGMGADPDTYAGKTAVTAATSIAKADTYAKDAVVSGKSTGVFTQPAVPNVIPGETKMEQIARLSAAAVAPLMSKSAVIPTTAPPPLAPTTPTTSFSQPFLAAPQPPIHAGFSLSTLFNPPATPAASTASVLDTFTPATKPVPTLTTAPPQPVNTEIFTPPTPTYAKDSVVTTSPSPVARTKTFQTAPTMYSEPTPGYATYTPPPVTDGPRYPANIQPVNIIQPVMVPSTWGGGGGGGGVPRDQEVPPGLEPTPIVITRNKFPWWLVALGVGYYLHTKKVF